MKRATFAAGCFWGVEVAFQDLKGVVDTKVGFMGGSTESPSYRQVCTDRTGHAEVVHITYDDSIIGYGELLDVFWSIHDPTQKDRQGPDVGTQYRTAIFFHDDEQRMGAEMSRGDLERSHRYARPIATAIERAGAFWPAEEYH
ncbi:MAG: peptide-methionine (S)-S-oxide reductase MsrA [Methanomassiliicoccales archaeon]|nr:peptide-methionine (S)-S-oxide reductase MsrA [Methanomassiliicoccales archaeon]